MLPSLRRSRQTPPCWDLRVESVRWYCGKDPCRQSIYWSLTTYRSLNTSGVSPSDQLHPPPPLTVRILRCSWDQRSPGSRSVGFIVPYVSIISLFVTTVFTFMYLGSVLSFQWPSTKVTEECNSWTQVEGKRGTSHTFRTTVTLMSATGTSGVHRYVSLDQYIDYMFNQWQHWSISSHTPLFWNPSVHFLTTTFLVPGRV